MSVLPAFLLLLTFLLPAAFAGLQCGETCKFRMCSLETGELRLPLPRVLIRPPGRFTLSGVLCRSDVNLGLVREVGEALLNDSTALSKYSPAGLNKPFAADFFQIGQTRFRRSLQGISRKKSMGNQFKFLDNLCVTLPIVKYDTITSDGTVMNTVMGGKDDCVAFRTRYGDILVELQWNSSDDFDLAVIEPDGDVVNSRSSSEAGRLNNDNGVGVCDLNLIGRETVIYDASKRDLIESGKYTFQVRHKFNCGDGETKFAVKVMVRDKVVFKDTGVSNEGGNKVVYTGTFTV